MTQHDAVAVIGFVAWSGTGKTTLLKTLIPILKDRGLCIGLVKHAHHDFDIDYPGKDSYELRKAGAQQVVVASRQRHAMIREWPQEQDPQLPQILDQMDKEHLDLILVEGFKHEPFDKIELHRSDLAQPWLFPTDPDIIALACDDAGPRHVQLPVLDINQPETIADFIQQHLETRKANGTTKIAG